MSFRSRKDWTSSASRTKKVQRNDNLVVVSSLVSEDDENVIPLAVPAPRRDPFTRLHAWSLINSVSSEASASTQPALDGTFLTEMMKGIYHRAPVKTSFVMKDRRPATMTEFRDGYEVSRKAEDVRRRQEHAERRITRTPMLLADDRGSGSVREGIIVARRAMLCELRDFYAITSSLEARKYDLRGSDIQATFEWFKMLENFLRCYLVASEKAIYVGTEVDKWGSLHGKINEKNRKGEKMRIIELSDRIELLKRPMLALDTKCGQLMGRLHRRVDDYTMRLVRFLNLEAEQVPSQLESKLENQEVDGVFHRFVKEMFGMEHGRDMVILLSFGLGMETEKQVEWLKRMCGGITRSGVQVWIKKVMDRHNNYVRLFKNAETEYRELYCRLSRLLDSEIAEIHDL